MNKIIFLITTDKRHIGTATVTDYSGIFIKADDPVAKSQLDTTESNVLDFMLEQGEDCIRCGCVEGVTEDNFSTNERTLLEQHGLNKRFSF